MPFKYRLETSLHLAEQEKKIAQGILSKETRLLYKITERKEKQSQLLDMALKGQKKACLESPGNIEIWHKYSLEQNQKLIKLIKEVEEQQRIVEKCKDKLLQCRIKTEKFKRLKAKKLQVFYIAELKKEQKIIDEIAQGRTGWH